MLNEKKVDRMLKSLYLWLNCEAKLQELVHPPNRVQFQIHPLLRESGIVLSYRSLKFKQRINFCLNPRLCKRDLTKQ